MIGNRLREQRKKAHLTQAQLGAQLHLSKNSISNYERNQDEPPDDTKIKLAKILGVSVDYLTGASDNPSPYVDASNTVRLPAGMPPQAWDELRLFIDYLKFKYLQHKEP
ncbi:MAG TPA: helix-turn-helix transcriptional regulator [Candidatus Gallacutalibacter stercoravium]|nr:helix-turn-helix transcriptional regulator [Candidatus Gallacutalibacter stercoravium]